MGERRRERHYWASSASELDLSDDVELRTVGMVSSNPPRTLERELYSSRRRLAPHLNWRPAASPASPIKCMLAKFCVCTVVPVPRTHSGTCVHCTFHRFFIDERILFFQWSEPISHEHSFFSFWKY
jgi:hypothetical protein